MRIFGSPPRYIQGRGAFARLGAEVAQLSARPVMVIDAQVLELLRERLNEIFRGAPPAVLPFAGEVTIATIERLTAEARGASADLVICVGGGKALDAAKGVARRLEVPFVTVPTVASNDSPTGRSLAVYDDDHTLVAIEATRTSPLLVLVDTALIVGAPVQFLQAGMGDAIAKKFEAERAVADGATNFFDGSATRLSLMIADGCYRTLREYGAQAVAAAREGVADEAFEAVVEANVLLAGLAWENAGLSFAHAITRGLVKSRAANAAHGFHVAYATLVQLALEERPAAFLDDLMEFYRAVGLPVRLADLGMAEPTPSEVAQIASLTLQGPQGGRIIVSAGAPQIAEAIERVERLASPAGAGAR